MFCYMTIASGFKETKAKHELLAVFIVIIIIIIEADVLMQCKNKYVPNSGPDWFRPCWLLIGSFYHLIFFDWLLGVTVSQRYLITELLCTKKCNGVLCTFYKTSVAIYMEMHHPHCSMCAVAHSLVGCSIQRYNYKTSPVSSCFVGL